MQSALPAVAIIHHVPTGWHGVYIGGRKVTEAERPPEIDAYPSLGVPHTFFTAAGCENGRAGPVFRESLAEMNTHLMASEAKPVGDANVPPAGFVERVDRR